MNTSKAQEIAVRYRWTEVELRNAYYCERNAIIRPVFLWTWAAILALLLVALILKVVLEGLNASNGSDLALTFALVVSVLQIITSQPLRARHFKKHNDLNADLNWAVTPEGLECRVGAEVKHRFDWSDVRKVTEGKKGVLLYPAPKTFYWFPFHAFATPEDLNAFLKYASTLTRDKHHPARPDASGDRQ
jgi:hypothetical protein